MSKSWEPTPSGARKFARELKLNRPYYVIVELQQPWGNEHVWDSYTFTRRDFFTGAPMSGTLSAARLLQMFGTVYEEKPTDVRGLNAKDQRYRPDPQIAADAEQDSRPQMLLFR